MNSNTIFLKETIQHNDLKVYLYILRLPASPQEHQQLVETVKQNNIKIIFYFGTQSFEFKNQGGINIQQAIQDKKALQKMEDELIKNKSNIALMCSETCEICLQMYLHYMVKIEKKDFSYFQKHDYWHIWPIDQLTQLYEEISKQQNINIFDYNLLKTNSHIDSHINSHINSKVSNDCQSEIISQEYPRDKGESYIINSQIAKQQISNILQSQDQVKSEFYPPPLPDVIQVPNKKELDKEINQPQHRLKFDNNKYELPRSIAFIHDIPKNGFICLE